MPPDMPAAKLRPVCPSTATVPPVMYSQPWSPTPSTTACAPELRTAKRSPGHAAEVRLARDRAVEHHVAGDDVLGRLAAELGRGLHADAPARQALAAVVVGVADRSSVTPFARNAPKLWPAEPAKRTWIVSSGQPVVPVALRDLVRQHRADGAVDVADRHVDRHLLAALERGLGELDQAVVERLARARGPAARRCSVATSGPTCGLMEDPREVEPARLPVLDALLRVEQVGAADQIVELCARRAAPSARALPRRRRRRS